VKSAWPTVAASAVLALSLCGCGRKASDAPSPAPQGIGQDVGDIGHDVPIVKQAEAAAGEVVRATGDCDAAKAAFPRAQAAVDSALQQVRTGAARSTLTNLKKQIQDTVGACP
jgi:hypothetical protein